MAAMVPTELTMAVEYLCRLCISATCHASWRVFVFTLGHGFMQIENGIFHVKVTSLIRDDDSGLELR